MSFDLRVLGAPSVTDENGRTPASLGWGKPLALLCLLAVRGEVRREEVVDFLWRDVDEAKARNAFRQALHRLRTALGEDLVPQDRERLRLVPGQSLAVDIDQFNRAVAGGRLDEALEHYRGHFLEGTELGEPAFDLWAEQERTRLQTRYRQVLQDAVSQAAANGRWADAIARSRRLTQLVPFDPGAAHVAATTLVSAGRRLEALDFLRQFATRLHDELGLELPEELRSMATRLERQRPDVAGAPAGAQSQGELALPLVGRESELSQLLTLWRTTGEDAGALALIEGPAGLGKSRLIRELVSHARSLGRVTVLSGRERVTGVPLPLGLFAEAFRPLVRASGIAGASRHLLAEATRLLPELRDNFDLPPVTDVEDEASRVRFFEGIAALVDSAAYEQPILLVLEDLHAITPSSLDLLSYLTVRLGGSAVMFALSLRDADAPSAVLSRIRALADASASPPHGARAVRRVLEPLSVADCVRCASEAARHLGLPDAMAMRAGQRCGGSPAHLLALLRQAASGEEIAAHPVSARAITEERLQRLTSAQRRFLVVLALSGRPVSLRLAADSAHVSQAAARESAAVLEHEGLVDRLPDDTIGAAELPAQVALESAGSASRNFLAAWVAEALAADPRSHPAELARFYAMAGLGSPAYEAARRAAYGALAVGAVAEAVQFLASARTFATTATQKQHIESLLTSLGSGRQRIAAQVEAPAAESAAKPVSTASPAELLHWRERFFPNWRVLFGAALATLVISATVLATRAPATASRATLADTLVLVEGSRGDALRYVSGDLAAGFLVSGRIDAPATDPPWLDSLSRPWTDAIAAPGGRNVALGRVTASGTDLFVISSDRRDTTALAAGVGDARPLAWSPDGRWLLATTNRPGAASGFVADLVAYRVGGGSESRVIDAAPGHSIVEAAWSPDGTRIAWVSRVGAGDQRQLEIFVSLADGSQMRNVSRHPADDHHISWSTDGELLAFTSIRDGNAELYAMGVRENRLWRLTRDPAQDDRGVFSRNGRFIAFESTRGGSAGVWVMPGLGGDARRVDVDAVVAVSGWRGGRGGRNRYVDRVRVEASAAERPGDTVVARLAALDQFDEPIPARDVEWIVIDSALATLAPADTAEAGETRRVIGKRAGLARLVGTAGRWRRDTAFLRIGGERLTLLRADAATGLRDWLALGVPAPTPITTTGRAGIAINADRQWDSGILSRGTVPLMPGLRVESSVMAPLREPDDPALTAVISLVAPEDEAVPVDAPQFLAYASVTWRADASRLIYMVGPETFSEAVTAATSGDTMRVSVVIEADSTVSFAINGRKRWQSALRIIDVRREQRVNLWIGGRATGTRVRVAETAVSLAPGRRP